MTIKTFKNLIKFVRKNLLVMDKLPNRQKKCDSRCSPNMPTNQSPSSKLQQKLNTNDLKFEVLPAPVKSASDKKEYKVIRLENGLTACLVCDTSPVNGSDDESDSDYSESESEGSDECSEKSELSETDYDGDAPKAGSEQKLAAAALCIGVGSFSDPKDIPGMAHFLEHMVFMGSEKFPEENDFDSFISNRGGSDNASTDCEMTTFYFECLEKHFFEALDKFAQFFISPLMKRGSMTREREAIESEFQMALPSDGNRKEQLLSSLSQIDSPVNTFTWGNLVTLRDNVDDDKLYKAVHEFRKLHYSAHRMTVAIQARLPIDVLQSYVLDCFSKVPFNNLPPDDFKKYTNVFDTAEFTKLYYVQPTNNVTQVDLIWALPSLLHKYRSKPHHYVSWLLGDEGKGSLLSYLRNKVWVLSMSTGNGESGSEHNTMYALFSISMNLTAEGLEHLNEVIEVVFSYINMLKEQCPEERIYDEIKSIEDTSFRFSVEETAADLVEDLAESMQLYHPEDYLTGSELYFEYDPECIKMVLDNLTPQKMNVTVLSNTLPKGVAYTKTEQWFGTKYVDQEIPEDWLKKWKNSKPLPEFSLPRPNEYLTKDFKILPENDCGHPDFPTRLLCIDLGELWYRKDQKFKLPVACYYFYLVSPLPLESPKSFPLMDFFINLLQIQLIEEAYPAQVAELTYSFKISDKGIVLKVAGYNEKLPLLIELITKYLVTFNTSVTREMFNAVKDKLFKYYYNNLLKPVTLAKDVKLHILLDNYRAIVDRYNAISSVSFEDVQQFATDFFKNLYVKTLVQGNVAEEVAIDVFYKFISHLKCEPLPPNSYPKYRVHELPKGETLCQLESFNKNDSNSIVTNYYQANRFSVKDSVIIDFIMLIIQEPLFNTLRTKEQLGYHVYCSIIETYGILGFTVTVNAQATKNTTQQVDSRIEEFMKYATKLLSDMSQETFEETRKNLIKMKQITDVHLKEEVNRNWVEIINDKYLFDRLKQEVKTIEQLQLSDVQDWWQKHSSCGSKEHFRKLSIQVVGFNTKEGSSEKVKEEKDPTENEVLDTELTMKFLPVNNENESEGQRNYIKNINDFKKDLNLHPFISKCT